MRVTDRHMFVVYEEFENSDTKPQKSSATGQCELQRERADANVAMVQAHEGTGRYVTLNIHPVIRSCVQLYLKLTSAGSLLHLCAAGCDRRRGQRYIARFIGRLTHT